MAEQFPALTEAHRRFIARQHMFFTASAAPHGRVNLSPKGLDSLRILDDGEVVYLDRTGSGNETAAHLLADGRLTIMFCAFEGPPLILRLYGRGRILPRGGVDYETILAEQFDGEEPLGSRQMVALDIEMVQTSCGYAVPHLEFVGERPALDNWATAKGPDGLEAYWAQKNMVSIDGMPTGFTSRS
ncbi:pyridoxamine 5'-phosphate oxidase family protein [Phenylobacterium sp.]|uniref:pyridoxamine 5'-phosphate oxidase family protein n=1 Tax=Phenylobacterium sp. TaxID=1871053 RepID=UPI002733765B|nr:pyridoxamine 5'-phosphate oxidase family protein [Phenylobacterium sp.]MDP3660178.1 pyridoxamine 5'-phosphate oxidase family protein [Phenylobacterium sp.]